MHFSGLNPSKLKSTDFNISATIMWLLVILSTTLVILCAFATVGHWENLSLLFVAGAVSHLITWLLVLNDIVKHHVFNKTFWIISMVALPTLALVVYMIRRNKILQ
jgi:hypothetical protein